jgi:ABC-type antimicrobial peptide transport system permease subunit
MILRDTSRLVLLGCAAGVPLAYAGGRFVAHELHGLRPDDPGVAVASLLLIALVGLLAGAVPAWRAAHLEPLDALRQD